MNVLQAVGFLSRITTGGMRVNHLLGYAILALTLPAAAALVGFTRAGAGLLHVAGPIAFLAFAVLLAVVDYAFPVEFRSPARPAILVPFLVLFFGSILLLGLPMYRIDRRLWLVTVATTLLLLGAMGAALREGVG